jgi:hypothetical protein
MTNPDCRPDRSRLRSKRLGIRCEAGSVIGGLSIDAVGDASGNKKCYRYHDTKEYDDCKAGKARYKNRSGERVNTSINQAENLLTGLEA